MRSDTDRRRAGDRLRNDAGLRIAARVASSAMLGVFVLLLARALSVDSFGQFILAYTIGLVIGLVAGFGAPVQVMRSGAGGGDTSAVRLYVVHTVSVSLVFVLAGAVVSLSTMPLIVVAGGLFAYSDTLQNFAQNFLAGIRAHTAASCLVVVQRAVPLAAWGAMAALGQGFGDIAVIVVFASTSAAALLIPTIAVGTRAVRSAVAEIRELSPGEVAHFWALSMSGILAQLQVSALAVFAPPATVGYFAMASRVTGPLTLLSAAVSTVAVPELAGSVDDPSAFDRIYRRYRNLILAYCLLVMVIAWPAAWMIVQIVGAKYQPAQMLLVGMIIAAGISSVSQALSSKYIALGRPDTVTVAIVIGGATTLALLLLAGAVDRLSLIWLVPVAGQSLVLAVLLSDIHEGGRMTSFLRTHWERALLVVTAIALVVAGASTFLVQRESADPVAAGPAQEMTAAAGVRPAASDEAVKILVIGDSFTEGTTYGGKGTSNWTRVAQAKLSGERLNRCPVLLRVSGRGGAGYLTTGIRHTTFASEAQRLLTRDVSAIVLVGSGNDLSHPSRQYRAAVDETIAGVRKARPEIPVVIVGLSWIHDAPVESGYLRANKMLASVAARHRSTFVDPIRDGWYDGPREQPLVGADMRHPTDEGHAIIAARMTPILADLGRKGACA
ncbi:GDSL-type esterase/lipase family protein [Gordonia sp. 'Campus']|uniref:GDSL-type esterase/lipase family protein n=1 Tax=Gordonia sp. 'Campus' TaxID=2915824 RepID=UPI001EE3A61F|nr:GDSL-type esterase/lipase family protein [Gordonia sp. 'Campus']